MKKIITVFLLFLFSTGSYGEKLTESEVNQVNNIIFESLSKENFIKMNRITSGGKLSSCELEYQYSYRDTRLLKGTPVMIVGSFSMMYFQGKNIIYAFKIVPNISDVKTQTWNYRYPQYSDVFIDNKSIDKFKSREFKCDPRGKCTGYSDSNLSMTELVLTPTPFDGEVKFSLEKGGMDNSFKFSTLLPKNESDNERKKFNTCMFEILDLIRNDLESIKK
jgi:hypothetical protein